MLGFGPIGDFTIGQVADGTLSIPIDGWFKPLSEPVRFPAALKPAQQQFTAYVPNPTTVTPFAWFAGLSEPQRFKPGLAPSAQQFFAGDTAVIPVSRLTPWFVPLSEPLHKLPGLDAARQQFLAAPSQLRPNPTTFATLSATEQKDTMLAGVRIFNRVLSGEIGVIEARGPVGETGITIPQVTRASVSITIR